MKKKLGLNLKGLKVQSFVTSLHDGEKTKIRGGITGSCDTDCGAPICQPTGPGTCSCATACGTCITDCHPCDPPETVVSKLC